MPSDILVPGILLVTLCSSDLYETHATEQRSPIQECNDVTTGTGESPSSRVPVRVLLALPTGHPSQAFANPDPSVPVLIFKHLREHSKLRNFHRVAIEESITATPCKCLNVST